MTNMDERAAREKLEQIVAERRERRRAEHKETLRKAAKEADDLRARLEDEYGVKDNPKRDLLWRTAWDIGHGSGLSDVEYYYDLMVELIK